MRTYRAYTEADVIEAAKKATSIATLLKAIGLKPAGGNYIHIQRIIQRLKIDTSHWTGKGWNKSKQLKNWSQYTRVKSLKKHLINARGHKCEKCCLTHWLDYDIVLEVHHIDGDRTNNQIDNLQLLCCNCHATTSNWRNKKVQ
jgi:HNH endonuclease